MPLTQEGAIIEALFRIANKGAQDVDFILNSTQRQLDENLSGRDLVPKARQEGVSSYFLARYLAACLMRRNVRAVVISHDAESTQRLLARVRYYCENIKGPSPVIENMSKNEITFPKMSSAFYIGTAGSRRFGRGDTITHLHCSEYAYWPDPAKLSAGLFQAVPETGEIAIESTGNGLNDYYVRCMRAAKGQGRWKLHFFSWTDFPEYTHNLSPEQEEWIMANLDPALEEDELIGILTPGQLSWRREKLEEMNYDLHLFRQEYPLTLDQCFQATGESVFYKVRYEPTPEWVQEAHDTWHYRGHPNELDDYVVGVDPAGGVEKDSAVIQVVSLSEMRQVYEFVNNRVSPDMLAGKVAEVGQKFNYAYTVVEQNNHGLVTLAYLRDIYPSHLIHRDRLNTVSTATGPLLRMGIKTNSRSKPIMVGLLRKLLAEDLVVHSPILRSELSTFVETEGGDLEAAKGCHDDTVIAMACAAMGINRAQMKRAVKRRAPPKPDDSNPFLFDNIVKELTAPGEGFPIRPQHAGAYRDYLMEKYKGRA